MSDIKVKEWKPGMADEVWKLMACARDAQQTDELLGKLSYILTDAGADTAKGIELIRQMTGDQIIDGLKAYRESSYKSVRAAYHENGKAA